MVIIAGHAVLLIKTVGELWQLQAVGETEDTALQGFLPMPAGLTVCSLSAEGKRYLFMVSLTECEFILKGLSTQIQKIYLWYHKSCRLIWFYFVERY